MHNLLKRQLKKYLGDPLQVPTEWQKFVEAVNDAYMQSDVDRGMLERSLDLSSQELLHTNSEMRALISLLSATIESTADGILVVNRESKIVTFNQKFVEMWHLPRQILESRNDERALSFVLDQLKYPEVFLKKVRELYADPESESYDEILLKDGRVFERYSKPQRIGQAIAGRVWSFHDITERKRAEERLRRSEEYFRALIENSSDVIIIADKKGTITYTSPSIERFLGYKPKELIGKSGFNFILPADLPRAIYDFGKAIITKEVNVPNAFRVRHKDGSERILEGVGRNLFDNPAVEGFVMNARDVSERKQAQAALLTSAEKFKGITNAAKDAIIMMDNEGNVSFWNRAAEEMFGHSSQEILGKELHMALAPQSYHEAYRKGLVEFKTTGQGSVVGKTLELMTVKKDGTAFPVELSVSAVRLKGEWSAIGIIRNITERKKMEEALRASEAELHDAYFAEATINMILGESLENIPFEEFLQKALNMILSLPWIAFEPIGSISLDEDKADVLVMKAQSNIPEPLKKQCTRVPFGKCLCGKAAQSQKIQFADHIDERHEICLKGIRPHSHYSVPILFGSRTLGVLNFYLKEGHIRDKKEEEFMGAVADTLAVIIAKKHAEEEKEKLHAQLLQAQKMEAVGQLAGGISHDFNNILTAMIGYGHLLKMKMKEEDPLRTYADHILSLSDRAANLTQSLLAFSRKQIMNPRAVDINEIIRRVDHLLSRIIGEDIKLQTLLSEKDLIVMADPGQIEQVLMNLAANARDAMPKGGLLTVGTETLDIDHEFIKEHGFGKEGQYALISLIDTGAGMDRETREKIFEPFFTTKEVGKGTGLGLSMVYGIIKQHDGYINVYSEPGTGTAFRIYLPLIEAKVEEIKPEVIQPIETGTETVLLAEDETQVREFTKKLLEEYGYKVITAASGQEAIDEFKAHKDKIQLLLLDVIMPNRNGREAYEEIRKIRPDIKVLFMSGYPADIINKHDIIEKGFAYIEKPASPTKLLRKIREVIEK